MDRSTLRLSMRALGPGALTGALVLTGCLSPNPHHCANRSGDHTCRDEGVGEFCSACTSERRGCVDAPPEPECHVGPHEPTPGGSTGDEPADGSDSGASCFDDAECPLDAPLCDQGQCVSCEALGGDPHCAQARPDAPQCVAGWCVACTPDEASSCPADSRCGPDLSCVGCIEHADCPNSACDFSSGTCLQSPRVLWVDGDYCGATGTQDDPYCDPMAALAAVGDDEAAVIKLVAASSPYETPLSVVEGTGKRVAILGIGGPAVRGGQAGLEVGAHHVFVDDIRLSDASVGVQCHAGGHLWIDDSVIIDNQVGVAAQGCELVIRRSRVLASESDAVRLTADSRLELRASVLAGNGADGSPSAALRVDASAFDIVGSTVVDNRGEVANARGGLHCNDGTGRVRNSVIVGPQGDSIDCVGSTVDHSVIDTELQGSEVEVVAAQDPAWFVDMTGLDVHVVSGAGPLLDAAMWWPGDPLTDIDGAAVVATPGRRMYAGADQP